MVTDGSIGTNKPREADEPRVGRSGAIGAAIGFVVSIIVVTIAGAAGLGSGGAFVLSLFVAVWGGAGFGFMTGATLSLAFHLDRQHEHAAHAAAERAPQLQESERHQGDRIHEPDDGRGDEMARQVGDIAPNGGMPLRRRVGDVAEGVHREAVPARDTEAEPLTAATAASDPARPLGARSRRR